MQSGGSKQAFDAQTARSKAAQGEADACDQQLLLAADLELSPDHEATMRQVAIELLLGAEDGFRRAYPEIKQPCLDAYREGAASILVLFGRFLMMKKWGTLLEPAPCSATVFLELFVVARRRQISNVAGILVACYGTHPWVNARQRAALRPLFEAPARTQ